MTCLSSDQIEEKRTDLARWELILANYNSALEGGLVAGIGSYRFDSGEGSQQAVYMKPDKLLDGIRMAESRVNRLRRELRGAGVIAGQVRRRG